MKTKRRYPERTKRRAVNMYRDGVPLREIQKNVGANHKTILKWARNAGLRRREFTRYNALTRRRAIILYEAGYSARQVANQLGIKNCTTVRDWLRAEGIEMRSASDYDIDRIPQKEIYLMTRLYEEGYSLKEIGALTGRHGTSVGKLFKRLGIRTRNPSESLKLSWEKGRKKAA